MGSDEIGLDQGPVGFIIQTPQENLVAHVRHALSLGLPEVGVSPERDEALTIIANGPTARLAPLKGPTLAVNGALRVFTDQGLAPTYWAACDPQALVADFLTEAPEQTIYLIASSCHPAVFEALKGRKVWIWHTDDASTWDMVENRNPVMAVASITLSALDLMSKLGFRRFEMWGWDGCYVDGRSHATDQESISDRVTVVMGGKTFATTKSWCNEAQCAKGYFDLVPYDIRINGGGMFGAILEHLA